VLHDERRGGAYTGDHLLPRTVATTGIQFDERGQRRPGMPDFVRSLERSRLLKGYAGWPGHGERLDDVGEASEWSLTYLARRTERVRRRLAEQSGTAYDLATRLLKHLKPEYIWSAMAETIGVLDLLVESGEAEVERIDGRLVYRQVGRG
jgi:glyoxylase-like metal-dependent hydrolase (beta-lactamase superfamily II)